MNDLALTQRCLLKISKCYVKTQLCQSYVRDMPAQHVSFPVGNQGV